MSVLIATLSDGSRLEFDRGLFDDWCVFLTRPHLPRYAPKDSEYFAALVRLGQRHGAERLYRDFVTVYALTGREVDAAVVARIRSLAAGYGPDTLMVELVLAMLYAGMVAEECKAHARLGKRVKRLGVCQILMEGMPVEAAASFSRGKPWREIARTCEALGF